MSERIHAVASGCYSDYRVLAVFSTNEGAEAFAAACAAVPDSWHDDARAIELPYFTEPPKRVTLWQGSVEFWDDGRVEFGWKSKGGATAEPDERWDFETDATDDRPRLRYVRAPCHKNKGGRLDAHGLDRDGVIKALADRAAMFVAKAWDPAKRGKEWEEIV